MLTNFILSDGEIFRKQRSKQRSKHKTKSIIEKQQQLLTQFDNELKQGMRSVVAIEQTNLYLTISNALWNLWNRSWQLGFDHALDDVKEIGNHNRIKNRSSSSRFQSGDLITFARKKKITRDQFNVELGRIEAADQSDRDQLQSIERMKRGNTADEVDRAFRKKERRLPTNDERRQFVSKMIDQENAIRDRIREREQERATLTNEFIRSNTPGSKTSGSPRSKKQIEKQIEKQIDLNPEQNDVSLPRVKVKPAKQLASDINERKAERLSRERELYEPVVSQSERPKYKANKTLLDQKEQTRQDRAREKQLRDQQRKQEVDQRKEDRQQAKAQRYQQRRNAYRQQRANHKYPESGEELDLNLRAKNIKQRVEEQESNLDQISSEVPLQSTKFGESYLKYRINTIAGLLNGKISDVPQDKIDAYNQQLKDHLKNRTIQVEKTDATLGEKQIGLQKSIPDFLKSTNMNKDKLLLQKIRGLLNSQDDAQFKKKVENLRTKKQELEKSADKRPELEKLKNREKYYQSQLEDVQKTKEEKEIIEERLKELRSQIKRFRRQPQEPVSQVEIEELQRKLPSLRNEFQRLDKMKSKSKQEKSRQTQVGQQIGDIENEIESIQRRQQRQTIPKSRINRNTPTIANQNITDELTDEQKELIRESKRHQTEVINKSLARQNKPIIDPDRIEKFTINDLDQAIKYYESKNDDWRAAHRIAATELTHAYNLGRVSHYLDHNVQYVKFNNSLEHETRGAVCKRCEDRATDNKHGLGPGVYELKFLLRDPTLMPACHPYCACYLSPVNEDDVNKKLAAVHHSIFHDNVAKWAAGGILGTAIMTAMFLQSRERIGGFIEAHEIPIVEPQSIAQQAGQMIAEKGVEKAIQAAKEQGETLLPVGKEEGNRTLLLPASQILDIATQQDPQSLLPLQIPERLSVDVDYSEMQRRISESVKQKIDMQVSNTVSASDQIQSFARSVNPRQPQGLVISDRIETIKQNIARYNKFSEATPQAKERLLESYLDDTQKLNQVINQIEDNNSLLMSQQLAIQNTINQTRDSLRDQLSDFVLPDNVTLDQFIDNSPQMRSLFDSYDGIQNTLRQNIGMQNEDGYYHELKSLQNDLFDTNPELVSEYLKDKNIERKIRKQYFAKNKSGQSMFIKVGDYQNNLKNAEKILRSESPISRKKYQEIFDDLEHISKRIASENKRISLTNVNLDLLMVRNPSLKRTAAQSRAAYLFSYKYEDLVNLQRQLQFVTQLLLRKPISN